ncbi:MAG: conjugal transfer protein TraC [bacterium]
MSFLGSLFGSNQKKTVSTEILPMLPTNIYEEATLELQDIIAPSALEIGPKSLHLGDKIARTYFVMSYPRFLSDNWFSPIINLDKIFDVAIYIHPIDTATLLKKFQTKVAEVQSQISERESKGVVRDPMLDTAYRDLEELRDNLMQAQEKMFEVGIYITLYADNDTELFKVENEIKSILESKMIYIKPALFQQIEAFKSVIPTNDDILGIHQKLNSEPLSSIFPFVSFDLSSEKGIMYGINRHNSGLVIFDRFSLENYNSVTIATSGSGKSFCTKLEILRTLMFDTEVIVIDPEREYEYLAEAVGGRYFNISLSSDNHINPFDLPIPRDDETAADLIRSQVISLVGLFRLMLGGLTPEEDSIMDRAITEAYALKDITPESDLTNAEPPLLSDLEMVLAGMEGANSVLQRLRKYTRGAWSTFINQPSNVDMNKKLVVFSIRDMEEELKPIAMYLVMQYIWNTVRRTRKKRLLVVDEAWIMMKSEDTASFLYGIAKRCRKYYLGLATITQNVDDFMKTPYGIAIVTNASMQLLLKQSPSSIEKVQEVFHLTDEEKYLLLESGVGEGIFFAGLKHVAIKIQASYTEEQIITSDPAQLLAIDRAKSELHANETIEKAQKDAEISKAEEKIMADKLSEIKKEAESFRAEKAEQEQASSEEEMVSGLDQVTASNKSIEDLEKEFQSLVN